MAGMCGTPALEAQALDTAWVYQVTGHSLRKTAASLLLSTGHAGHEVMAHCRWKSSQMLTVYADTLLKAQHPNRVNDLVVSIVNDN